MSAFGYARMLVGLKWRLMTRAKSGFEQAALLVVIALAVLAVPLVSFAVITLGGRDEGAAIVMVSFTVVAVAWLLLTIVGGGGETIVDPQLFTIYPVSQAKLVVGFLAAAFVGVPALATAAAALAAIVHGPSLVARLLIAVGAIAFVATAVLSGRIGISWMSGMLRSRRTREVATWIAAIIGLVVGAGGPIASELGVFSFDWSLLADVRPWVRWVPWGWAPEAIALAMEGRTALAALVLVPSLIFALVLGRVWASLLERILTSRGVSGEGEVDAELVPRLLRRLGRRPIVAVWARSLRQLRRDPREILEVAAFLPAVVMFALPGIQALRDGDERAVLSTAAVGLALSLTTLNMFGADGRSFGVDALAAADMRDVLVGKALARVSIGVPAVVAVAIVLSVISRSWALFIPATAIAWTQLFAASGVGIYMSAHSPFPLPEKVSAGGGQNQGCATAIVRVGAMFMAMVAAMPGILPTILVSLLVGPVFGSIVGVLSVIYGIFVFAWLARSTGEWANANVPRIFQELSRAL